ncbi:MFS family permease [Paenibacillus eucommiae]|uniref:MFS family permease n=2 Tax=Paenibacillus eucommiae TaxID=1355755 RepID=A0ABS4J5Q0_9BACL|nr:MFS family permease [Paenibacillus eucommiae]
MANATMFTTYAIYQVIALGLNPLQLLLVGMILEVTVLIFEGITGVIADMYSRRLSVILGMFVLGFGFVLEGSAMWLGEASLLMSAFMWLLLAQVFFGIGATFISGADTAWIVDEVGEERAGRIFLKAKRVGLFGTLVGIVLSVSLSAIGPNLPYIAGGMMYLMLGIFLLIFMKETNIVRAVCEDETSQAPSHWRSMKATWLSGAQVIGRQPVLLLVLIVTLFSGAASEGYDRLWQAFLIVDIGFPQVELQGIHLNMASWIGLIAVMSTLLSLLVMWVVEKRIDMSNERVVLRGMIVLTVARIAGVLALAFAPSFAWALVAILLFEVVRTVNGPMYDTWLNLNIESKSRATVISMMSQSDALGQTAGGPFVGWIGKRYSVRMSLVAAAVLLAPILAVYSRARHKR